MYQCQWLSGPHGLIAYQILSSLVPMASVSSVTLLDRQPIGK